MIVTTEIMVRQRVTSLRTRLREHTVATLLIAFCMHVSQIVMLGLCPETLSACFHINDAVITTAIRPTSATATQQLYIDRLPCCLESELLQPHAATLVAAATRRRYGAAIAHRELHLELPAAAAVDRARGRGLRTSKAPSVCLCNTCAPFECAARHFQRELEEQPALEWRADRGGSGWGGVECTS